MGEAKLKANRATETVAQAIGVETGGGRKNVVKSIFVAQIPSMQRRPPPLSLEEIERTFRDRNAAILAAYATGGYSYQQLADYFGLHFTTVGRIVRKDI